MKRLLFIILLAVGLLWPWPAQAVSIAGTDEMTAQFVMDVLEQCYLPYQVVDEDLGEVEIRFEDHHDPYWEQVGLRWQVWGLAVPGQICITSQAGPGPWLAEIVAHEWSHEIWFAMGPAWRERWYERAPGGDTSSWYTDPAEHFAECMRCGLWPVDLFVHREPRTSLNVVSADECRGLVDLWRWSMVEPFTDLDNEDDELRAAAGYAWTIGVVQGYPDRTLGAYKPLLRRHVALVCERLGLECSLRTNDYAPAVRADVRDAIPGLQWKEERWDEPITRGQLVRLIYRKRLDIDAQTIERLEQWFANTWVEYQGVSRQPRLLGYAYKLVECSREYNIPLWLALGQCWRESQWFTTGLSIRYNCGWGIKDTRGRWGRLGTPPLVSGYSNYVSIDEAIEAYFKLMASDMYAGYVERLPDDDALRGLLNKYAPAFENDVVEHYRIVMTVRRWCEKRGIW